MMVVPEGGSLYQHNMSMVVDGHTTVEHSIPLAHLYADVHQLWRQTKVAYTPMVPVEKMRGATTRPALASSLWAKISLLSFDGSCSVVTPKARAA